jgi:glycosyltransferase involved in cell wall biosynthesis
VKKVATDRNVKLKLIGIADPNHILELKSLIQVYDLSAVVSFEERGTRDDLAEQFAASDIYLQMEFVNEFGNGGVSTKSGALAAAMAAGLPIISARGDMTDSTVFRDKENIFFAYYKDEDSVFNAVTEILNNQSLAKKLARGSEETYANKLSWDHTVAGYISLLNLS